MGEIREDASVGRLPRLPPPPAPPEHVLGGGGGDGGGGEVRGRGGRSKNRVFLDFFHSFKTYHKIIAQELAPSEVELLLKGAAEEGGGAEAKSVNEGGGNKSVFSTLSTLQSSFVRQIP